MSSTSPFAEKSGSLLGNLMIPAAAILGSLVAFGVFSNKNKKHEHHHAQVKSVPSPLKPRGPLITKVNSVVTPEVPAVVPAAEPAAEPVLQTKSVHVQEATVEVARTEAPLIKEGEMTAEQTFEQYRQAMLHTGPRDMEYQARAEMQSKGGMGNNAMWREQTASLRKSLSKDAASLLDEMNVSINDRVVSDFNSVRDY
jgi:hypothetical protein